MNLKFPVAAAASILCCLSCVSVNYEIGGNLIPDSHQYKIVPTMSAPIDVEMAPLDSMSGYNSKRMAIGAVRDAETGLTSRSCALTLVPMNREIDFGTNPSFKRFHFSAAPDSMSVESTADLHILQTAEVYSLKEPMNSKYDYDVNGDFSKKVDWTKKINAGSPILTGSDSLSFDFTEEFGKKFLGITKSDMQDFDAYKKKFPGIYIRSNEPAGPGGRINFFKLQLDVDTDYYYILGNFARLDINSTYNGVKKDTSFYFYYSPDKFYSIDSLLTKSSPGSFPQSCLNLTGQDETAMASHKGKGLDKLFVEGGGGLKPKVSALELRNTVRSMIEANGDNPDAAIISTAAIVFPIEAPDAKFEKMYLFPDVMSPTLRMHKQDTTQGVTTKRVTFYGLTDASNENENQGAIDRSRLCYAPNITYHLQEILNIKQFENGTTTKTEAWKELEAGERDIWLISMSYETTTTVNESSSDMSDYYSMLAYQSYYQSMYGGYGGYGYGGYGGYGYGDPYSNYYSYMMAAMYANQSSTTTSTSLQMDAVRFYKAVMYGPSYSDADKRPRLEFAYAVPKE